MSCVQPATQLFYFVTLSSSYTTQDSMLCISTQHMHAGLLAAVEH